MEFYEDDPPQFQTSKESRPTSDSEMEFYKDDSATRESSEESSPTSDVERNSQTPKREEHSVHDDLSQAIEYLYRNYTRCRSCTSTDIVKVTDKQENVLMIWCQFCSYTFGVDDSMSPNVLLDLYKQGHIEVNIGCCANTDPNQIKIEGFDGSDFVVRCLKCKSYGILGDRTASKNPGPDELVCGCGNRDHDKMTVCVFGDEIRCVICKVCEAFIQLPQVASTTSEAPNNPEIPDPSEFISCECPPEKKKITITRDAKGEPEIVACSNCQLCYLPKNPMRSNSSELISCECSPEKKKITITRDAKGEPEIVACSNCQLCYLPKNPMRSKPSQERRRSPKRPSGSKPKVSKHHGKPSSKHKDPPQYREVQSIADLQRGDHILWDRWLGYGHHAIVEHVHPKRGTATVWHYNGSVSQTLADKIIGKIMNEELDPFSEKHSTVYVADYNNPFSADEVIQRALSRAGEVQYSLVSNNCEHFATWCKTGQDVSAQFVSLKDTFKKYAKGSSGLMSKLPPMLGMSSKVLGRYGSVAMMVPGEVLGCVKDISKSAEARAQGKLSRDAFVELSVSRVCQSLGGLAGMVLGMFIPIPFVGVLVGGTVGGLIGEFVGRRMGSLVVKGAKEIGRHLEPGSQSDE